MVARKSSYTSKLQNQRSSPKSVILMASATSTLSSALVRKADAELMPPPPPIKRIKRPPKILDEDTYTEALSEIIARDFFPGLVEAKHQQDYLDALESGDKEWIGLARRKLEEVMTPASRKRKRRGYGTSLETPRFGTDVTPCSVISTPESAVSATSNTTSTTWKKKVEVDMNMSLDAFQAKYTSEDNASFNDLLDRQNEKRRKAYAWMWSGQNRLPGKRSLMANRILKEREEKERAANGGELVVRKKISEDLDQRKAAPETWKVKPRNDLMFIPEGVDLDTLPPPPPITDEQMAKAELLPKKSISYANTRLPNPVTEVSSSAIPDIGSPSLSAIQDAITGRPRAPTSSVASGGSQTPRINGYGFVRDAPSPTPSELGVPPMTWGTIEGLEPTTADTSLFPLASTGPSPFKIKNLSRREVLLNKMVDKVAKNKRSNNPLLAAASTSSSLAGTPDSITGGEIQKFKGTPLLTPAGQRLMANINMTPRSGGNGLTDIEGIFNKKKKGSRGAAWRK